MTVKSGYDRYLEYQYGQSGDFFSHLFRAIMQADSKNTEKLRLAFPEEVDAYDLWAHHPNGVRLMAEQCSPDHPLLTNLKKEYPNYFAEKDGD